MGRSVHSKRRKANIRKRAKLAEPWLVREQLKINATLPSATAAAAKKKEEDLDVPVKMEGVTTSAPGPKGGRSRVVVLE